MFCANCGRQSGDSQACPYCGFNPVLDNNPSAVVPVMEPEPVKIELKKRSNGIAIVGFILSFFSFIPFLSFLIVPVSLILNIVGLAKSKITRTGKPFAIIGLLIDIVAIIVTILITAALFREAFGRNG